MARGSFYLGADPAGYELRLVALEVTDAGHRVHSAMVTPPGGDVGREARSIHRRISGIVGAVGLRDAAIRILTLPPTTDENLERVVRLEAEAALPLGTDEMALAHHMMGMTQQSRIEVLLAAAKQDAVVSLVSRLSQAPGPPPKISVTSISLINALEAIEGAGRPALCAVVRIEDDGSEMLVLDRTRVLTAQSSPIGCGSPAPAAAPVRVPDPESAVLVTAAGGTAPQIEEGPLPLGPEDDFAPAPGWVAAIASTLRYSLNALSYELGQRAERVYLCGKGATLPGVVEQLAERLGIDVRPLSPPGIEQDAPRFAVAYGAAVQAAGGAVLPLQLQLARILLAREIEQKRQNRFSWTVLAASLMLAISVLAAVVTVKKQHDLAQRQTDMQEFAGVQVRAVASPRQLETAAKELAQQLDLPITADQALDILNRQLPPGAWLSEMVYNAATGVVVRAYAPDPNAATQLHINLLQEGVFDEVTLDYRNSELAAGHPVWAFQISGRLRPRAAGGRRTGR